jgi:hypothetical protein
LFLFFLKIFGNKGAIASPPLATPMPRTIKLHKNILINHVVNKSDVLEEINSLTIAKIGRRALGQSLILMRSCSTQEWQKTVKNKKLELY